MDLLPDDISSKILPVCSKIIKNMKKLDGVTAVNICQNNGKDAGQVVPHVHFHLIPRHTDDKLLILPPNSKEMVLFLLFRLILMKLMQFLRYIKKIFN